MAPDTEIHDSEFDSDTENFSAQDNLLVEWGKISPILGRRSQLATVPFNGIGKASPKKTRKDERQAEKNESTKGRFQFIKRNMKNIAGHAVPCCCSHTSDSHMKEAKTVFTQTFLTGDIQYPFGIHHGKKSGTE